ncbi:MULTISPECIES: glucosaminidase domain-containing protein [Chitinophagaceae]
MKKTSFISLWRKTVLCFFVGSMFVSSLKAQSTAQKYIQEHSKLAMKLMQQSGVPASVILGVAMVESSLGRSKSSKILHNHFGIIGKNSKASEMGYKSQYRQFEDAEASYENFIHIVTSKSFYENMKGSLDFSKWLTNLNKAGYCATNQYIWKRDIMYFINKYSLNRYDKLANWQAYNVDLLAMLSR